MEWLLCVGGGNAPTNKAGSANEDNGQIVEVNPKFLMQSSGNHLHDIFEATSAENMLSKSTKESITKRAILTPGNETVDKINPYMLEKIKKIFISVHEYFRVSLKALNLSFCCSRRKWLQ